MDPRDSGIFRLASVGSYLDALSTITDEMSLKERSNLIFLDRCLHEHWGLGENVILNWCPQGDGVALLDASALRDRGLRERRAADPAARGTLGSGPKQDFFQVLLSGRRCLTPTQLAKVGRLLGIEATHLPLREPLEEHAGAERDHREDGQALQHHLRAEPRRLAVRHRGLQLADAVRADDAAQQPLVLAELRAEQAADEAHRRRFLAHDDGRRVLHLEPRPDARRQRQPLSLHAARRSPTTRSRTRKRSTTPCRGCARAFTWAAATSSTSPKG